MCKKKKRAAAMAPRKDDPKVLNFGGATLRQSDVARLENSKELINDQIIEFFFEYLTTQVDDSMIRWPSPLLLVGPAQTFWLLQCPPGNLQESIEHMSLPEREMVIFALNDNSDPTVAEGGNHWSLLVYSRSRNAFEHYDSIRGLNTGVAQAFVSRIKSHMGVGSSQATLSEREIPQQGNAYDCGLYVMKIAELLCNTFKQQQRAVTLADVDSWRTELTPASLEAMRASTVELILDQAKRFPVQ